MKFSKLMLASVVTLFPLSVAQAEESDSWRLGLNGGVTLYSGEQDPRFAASRSRAISSRAMSSLRFRWSMAA